MERNLSWSELRDILKEHEAYHNYAELTRFCRLFYPLTSRVVIGTMQEYDDENYYTALDLNNLTAYDGRHTLKTPSDEVELLVLLAEAPELREALAEDKPNDSLEWFSEFYYDEASNLELYRDPDSVNLEVDLASPPPQPKSVYFRGADDAVLADA